MPNNNSAFNAEKYHDSCRLKDYDRAYNQDLTQLGRATKCFS